MKLSEQVKETERRYAARTAEREQALGKLRTGGVLHADTPERVTRRLERLGADWSLAATLAQTPAAASSGRNLGQLAPELFGPAVLGLERLMGRNDLLDIAFLEAGTRAARAVGRIRVRGAGGHFGTGFLVSSSLLLTNNHVLADPEEAGRAVVELNFQAGVDGSPLEPAVFELEPTRFFVTDPELDFTFVAVAGRLDEFGWLRLVEAEGKAVLGEVVNIIQHPNGEPKQLALRENEIVDLLPDFVHYATDTAPGSSGSPVFNDQWEVVALHHSGVPRKDAHGRYLTVDGQLWTPEMGEHRLAWVANEGARISRVLHALRARTLTGEAARLRDEVFATVPAPARTVRETIEAELRGALVDVQVGQAREYYDETADVTGQQRYYTGIDPDGRAEDLLNALTTLVESTHTVRPGYKPSRMVYPWVDLHPDRVLRSIYSGKTFSAEEFVRADLLAEAARARRVRELLLESTPGSEDLAAIEAALPFNCEHVVPQSWFAKKEPMRGDLHHLFACESGCNSFRGNFPYFDFVDREEVVRDQCGRREDEGFEPTAGKGPVARATLYFLLRYPGMIGDTAKELPASRLELLLSWHEQDPVSEYERHRNAAIAEIQGNRNPFIDRPEWARLVDLRNAFA